MTHTAVDGSWLYGPPGWTHERGVLQILRAYLERPDREFREFARFSALPVQVARELLEALPGENLEDRQNLAPSCGDLLRASVAHPGEVSLYGYVVSAPRWDERVSLDGLVARGPLTQGLVSDQAGAWQILREHLGLPRASGVPDEVRQVVVPAAGTPGAMTGGESVGWWLWWD